MLKKIMITKVGKKSILRIRIRLDPNYFTGSDQLFVQKIYIKNVEHS